MRALLVAALVWAMALPALAASQLTETYKERQGQSSKEAIMLHCNLDGDEDDTLTGGQVCATGDWSKAFDARGYGSLTVDVREWGSGSATIKVWSCMSSLDGQWDDATTPPYTTASKTDGVHCKEITHKVTINGTTLQVWTPDDDDVYLGLIYFEVDACNTICNLRAMLSVKKD